jgi:N-carbamoyl-L-amino-acid hydrolase
MADRQDALIAAAHLTLAVRELVTQEPGPQVGTVGHLDIEPNASNVVPGNVRLSIDLRDLSSEKLRRLGAAIRARALAIGAQTKTQIVLTQTQHAEPALASPDVQAVIQRDGWGGADGDDIRAEHSWHQPRAAGVNRLGGLRARSQRTSA